MLSKESFASFHPPEEGRQHAIRPDRGFGQRHQALPLRQVYPFQGLLPVYFPTICPHASTFLRPFALRELPRFLATTDALTPARLSAPGQVSLIHVTPPSEHSVTKHLMPSRHRFSAHALQRVGLLLLPRYPTGFPRAIQGFAITPQARHGHQAESCFSSYGLVLRLLLLPTPPHGDAVTLGYMRGMFAWKGLSPFWCCAPAVARSAGAVLQPCCAKPSFAHDSRARRPCHFHPGQALDAQSACARDSHSAILVLTCINPHTIS